MPVHGLLIFTLALGLATWRCLSLFGGEAYVSDELWASADFRDAVFYPVRALLAGMNPYDTPAMFHTFPVGQHFPLYPPAHLLLHLPLGLLDYRIAWVIYCALTISAYFAIVSWSIRHFAPPPKAQTLLLLVGLLVLSRPGLMNLLLGQPSILAVAGTVLALTSLRRRNPGIVVLGTLIALTKPTFGLPLLILLWALREYRIAALAIGGSALLNTALAVPIIHGAGGLAAFIESVRFNDFWFHQDTSALSDYSRIDALALASRSLGRDLGGAWELLLLVTLLLPAIAELRRFARTQEPLDGQALLITCLAILLAAYHQTYDALLLILPLCWLLPTLVTKGTADAYHWTLAVLLLAPFFNYIATHSAISLLTPVLPEALLQKFVFSINAAALMLAYALAVGRAWRRPAPHTAGVRPRAWP